MTIFIEAEWRTPFLFSREQIDASDRAALLARTRRGELERLFPGIYVETNLWMSLDRHAKYRLRIEAVNTLGAGRDFVMSHESAAALWRLPRIAPWPDRIHVLERSSGAGRATSKLIRHPAGVPQHAQILDGIRVTDLARADLLDELRRIPLTHGRAKARRAIEFADGRADRPGESISRVSMSIAGLPAPQLQVEVRGASGRLYIVDFWWPQCAHIGEFDGRYEYTDPEFLRGRTPEQALIDEKAREDDLRAAGNGMSRWTWEVARSPQRLQKLLRAAGIR
jgi:hypothetical protein